MNRIPEKLLVDSPSKTSSILAWGGGHFYYFDYFVGFVVTAVVSFHYSFLLVFRSSYPRCFVRKGVLRNFAKFTSKHLYQSLFSNKVAGLRPATLFKKRLWHRCFPVNFAKFLRIPFSQNTSGRLLLILF